MRSLTQTPSRSESSEGFLNVPHADSQDSSSVGSGSNSLEDSLSQRTSSEYTAHLGSFRNHLENTHVMMWAVLLFLYDVWWWCRSRLILSLVLACSLCVKEREDRKAMVSEHSVCVQCSDLLKGAIRDTASVKHPLIILRRRRPCVHASFTTCLCCFMEMLRCLFSDMWPFFLSPLAVRWQPSKSFRSWGTDPRRKTEWRLSTAARCVRLLEKTFHLLSALNLSSVLETHTVVLI